MTDAPVKALVRQGDRLYLGGDFNHLGPLTGAGVALRPVTGTVDRTYPLVDGPVLAVQPDGAGGFYIGGNFRTVGAVRRRSLAHVLADGSVDRGFNPSPNGAVYALALEAGRLYVGGAFQAIGGRSRNRLAALDAATGAIDRDFDPNIGFEGVRLRPAPPLPATPPYLPGSTEFARRRAALPQFRSPSCTSFRYGFYRRAYFEPTGVLALAVSGDRLYVGGSFRAVTGVQRSHLAVVDAQTGDLDPQFDPDANSPGYSPQAKERRADTDGPVDVMVLHGSRLYIGGRFSSVAGRSRVRLAALDAATGAIDREFDPVPSGRVHALLAVGDRLYAGGAFSRIAGRRRGRVAALDPVTGEADAAFAPAVEGDVHSLAALGDRIYAAGRFQSVSGVQRKRIAALDATTGALDRTFDPNADSATYVIAASGRRLYAGGFFESVGGVARDGLAAIDLKRRRIDERFAPSFDMDVNRLAISGARIYAAGDPDAPDGLRALIAADRRTGRLDPRFRARVRGRASVLLATRDRLYLGMRTIYDESPPVPLLAISARTGKPIKAFRPRLHGSVFSLSGDARRLYVGGSFYRLIRSTTPEGLPDQDLRPLPGLLLLDGRSGARTAGFRPRLGVRRGGATGIYGLHRAGDALYVSGHLVPRPGRRRRALLLKLRASDGAADRRFRPPAIVASSLATSGRRLLVNGRPGAYAGVSVLDRRTGRRTRGFGQPVTGRVCAVEGAGRSVFAGGSFDLVDRIRHPHFAALGVR